MVFVICCRVVVFTTNGRKNIASSIMRYKTKDNRKHIRHAEMI
jgi:hypothetical protein